VKAHENFNDPGWDGPPEEVTRSDRATERGEADDKPQDTGNSADGSDEGESDTEAGPLPKIMVKLADGKARSIRYIATTTYWGPDGKPISAADFLQRLFGDLQGMIADEDHLHSI